MLDPTEQEVIDSLTNAYNKFVLLPPLHPWHNQEFMQGIHTLQHLVMARPYLRQLRQIEVNRVNDPVIVYEPIGDYTFEGIITTPDLPPIVTIEP